MNSRERLLTAWSGLEPDRVPIELRLSPSALEFSRGQEIQRFVSEEADNFFGIGAVDWGFLGLPTQYTEEVIEDAPGDFLRKRRVHRTQVGEFYAITRHRYGELNATDFHWERRFIHTLDDMQRLAAAPREALPVDAGAFQRAVDDIGSRGAPLVGLLHPLGRLVRQATIEHVYGWLAAEPDLIHQFLERANDQVAQTVQSMSAAGVGPFYSVTAHEMLIPPWMSPRMFDEFVFQYDKRVNDTIHGCGGRLRAHCHDKVSTFLVQMSAMGIDALEPLEPPPFGDTDLRQAKRLVGDRMLLSGNIPSQNFILMSNEDVRQCVRQAMEAAAPGGGYTLRTTGGTAGTNAVKTPEQMETLLERIQAYIDAGLEFGRYR
jgi:hypothetical protein